MTANKRAERRGQDASGSRGSLRYPAVKQTMSAGMLHSPAQTRRERRLRWSAALRVGYVTKKFGKAGTPLKVVVRGRANDATVTKMPFVPNTYFKAPTAAS